MKKDIYSDSSGITDREVFHIIAGGKGNEVFFETEEDYNKAVNRLAILTVNMGARLYAYCVMSTHVHFLVMTTRLKSERMVRGLLQFMASLHPERKKSRRLTPEDYMMVQVEKMDKFLAEIVYIILNPYNAKIDSPFSYRWSSANVYFNRHIQRLKGKPVSSITVRRQREIFATRMMIPAEWELDEDGVILDRFFVDFNKVVECFAGPYDFYNKVRFYGKNDSMMEEFESNRGVTYSDGEAVIKMQEYLRSELFVRDAEKPTRNDLTKAALMLRRKFGIGKAQIARVTGLSIAVVDNLF